MRRFLSIPEHGKAQGILEYAFILGLVIVAIVVLVAALATRVGVRIQTIDDSLAGLTPYATTDQAAVAFCNSHPLGTDFKLFVEANGQFIALENRRMPPAGFQLYDHSRCEDGGLDGGP